jgi:predicted transcriptional regulator of viral defense system
MTRLSAHKRLGPHEVLLLGRIQRSGRAVVRVRRDQVLFKGLTPDTVRSVLKRLADGGQLKRIERGVYAVAGVGGVETHTPLAIVADWLAGEPYVISGFFALAHWKLTHFPPTRVDILLTRERPDVRYGHVLFRFIYVSADRLPDAREIAVPGARALARIVEPERALTEVLSGRHATPFETANEAFERGLRYGVLTRRRLAAVARTSPSAAARRLGWIAEQHDDALAAALRPLVGNEGYVPVDPKASATGAKRNVTWRLLENVRAVQ